MFFAVTGDVFQCHIKRGNPVDQFPDAGRSKGAVLIDLENVQKCLCSQCFRVILWGEWML